MSFGKKVECVKCERQESLMWHQIEEGVQCNECLETEQMALKVKKEEEEEEKKLLASVEKSKSAAKKNVRSTRSYKTRQNPNALPKQVTPKGKGRRQIFKKNPPIKLTPAPPSMKIVTSVFHKGMFYRVGDIVSLRGHDGGTYFAQISGLLIDDYCEKSASLTWLFPTKSADRSTFNPMDYVLGYDDDLPRKLDYMEFVMHSPLEYYRNNNPPHYTPSHLGSSGFIWGRLSHMNTYKQ